MTIEMLAQGIRSQGIRSYDAADRIAVTQLLRDLPQDYPGGHLWLQQRLNEVHLGTAGCLVTYTNHEITGVLIFKRKSATRIKICTLYVSPLARGGGAGRRLLTTLLYDVDQATAECYITARTQKVPNLMPLLSRCGFTLHAIDRNRYGSEADEAVLIRPAAWNSKAASNSSILLPVHPHHAARIFSGDKPYEFRRRSSAISAGALVVLYETAPTSAVTGAFRVADMRFGAPRTLELLEPDRAERTLVRGYLAGALEPVALKIASPAKCGHAHPLRHLGLRHAPQGAARLSWERILEWSRCCANAHTKTLTRSTV